MKYFFHPKAKEEFIEAINYYEECSPDLGLEFSKEIHSTIQRIIRFPHSGFQFSENTRRCLTKRFPFGVIYRFLKRIKTLSYSPSCNLTELRIVGKIEPNNLPIPD